VIRDYYLNQRLMRKGGRNYSIFNGGVRQLKLLSQLDQQSWVVCQSEYIHGAEYILGAWIIFNLGVKISGAKSRG
jgi:hypothetical protein